MNRKIKQQSLIKHFKSNSRVTYGFLTLIIIIFSINFLYLFNNLGTINNTNSDLVNYYKSIELAFSSGKNYINTKNDYNTYKHDIENSFYYIESIQNNLPNVWQFNLLNNMTQYFNIQVENTANIENVNFQEEYEHLIKSYNAIMNSSTDYFSIITEESQNISNSFYYRSSWIIFISVILLFVFGSFSFYLKRKKVDEIVSPLRLTIGNIRKIRDGHFDIENVVSHIEEIHYLSDSIFEMSNAIKQNLDYEKNINDLQKKYLDEHRKNLKYEEMIAQSQLKMIQKRVDPHFLFNTLNSIYKSALTENADSTAELLEKTSTYFRYNLDYNGNMSNLIHEISVVKDYIYIQNLRFKDKIEFNLEIGSNIPPIAFPGMIIQPIIENSIETAFESTQDDKEINIAINYTNQILNISVSDNGKGMSEEDIDKVYMNDYEYFGKDSTLTLYNIYYRLKYFFEKSVRFNINTCEGCGFEVVITIAVGDKYETIINS